MVCEFRAAEVLGKEGEELDLGVNGGEGEGRRNQRSHLYLDPNGEWTEFAGGIGGELCVLSGEARALLQQRV